MEVLYLRLLGIANNRIPIHAINRYRSFFGPGINDYKIANLNLSEINSVNAHPKVLDHDLDFAAVGTCTPMKYALCVVCF